LLASPAAEFAVWNLQGKRTGVSFLSAFNLPRIRLISSALVVLASCLWGATRAEALAITIVPGSNAFSQTFGLTLSPVSNDIFLGTLDAAADYWEGLLLDDRSLRIEVGWGSTTSMVTSPS
jgi:hypothetical protein